MIKRLFLSLAVLLAATAPAFAHLNPAEHGSFMAGVSHPLFGLDHILAMVAVGLWAATMGKKAMIVVPSAFVVTMAIGFGLAMAGAPLPFVEPVILASVIFIGILIALALPLPTAGVAGVVAFFALFHGFAHGGELGAAGAWQFAGGFLVSTIMLHIAGIALGLGIARISGARNTVIRAAGGATAVAGLALAFAG